MDYRILGSLEVSAGGRAVDLGPPKQRAVLAVLLLHANEVVATDRLIELVWGERHPRTAAHSVQIYVSELRKLLNAVGGDAVIATRGPGYVLQADAETVDARRFERLVTQGNGQVRAGDIAQGAATLRAALALWTGAPLADFAYDDFAQPHVRHLEQLRWQAMEELAEAELSLGRAREALAALEALVEAQPLREHARELQLLALYRSGRQADALRVYEAFRRHLADELGIDPSSALQRVQGRILLQDPDLAPPPTTGEEGIRNPFKGLRAFTQADAGDFFGRRRLVDDLCARLADGTALLAVVGPSGCGKSSVVAAGLIPALRAGAVPGSTAWPIVAMVPGAQPADELQAALATAAPELMAAGPGPAGAEPLTAAAACLPPGRTLLVVIDQFEELFALAGEAARRAFLHDLTRALHAGGGRMRAVITLRADFYDRPLLDPEFAPLFTAGVVNVLPPTAGELEAAVVEPARSAGVAVEPALLAELVADAVGQPGALPLFQYALTELFDHRDGQSVTLRSYGRLGGLRGAVSRRAEDLYGGLAPAHQRIVEQLFLRLVTLGEGTRDTRRRVRAGELAALDLDPVDVAAVLERFGRHRLLTFDRDPISGDATVEVAHEALLAEWARLRGWIDGHRADLRRHAAFAAAVAEWQAAGRDPDYVLTGSRLAQYEHWSQRTTLQLTAHEQAFLQASRQRQRAQVALMFHGGRGDRAYTDMIATGFDKAVDDFDLVAFEVAVSGPEAEIQMRHYSERGVPLIIVGGVPTLGSGFLRIAARHPDTAFAVIDLPGEPAPNVTYLRFAEEQGSFLVGAAAALKTRTGTVGFIGGVDFAHIRRFQAGFEAGARRVDPAIQSRSIYLTEPPDFSGYTSPKLGAEAASKLYRSGADVVYHAAGFSGIGLFQAAVTESRARDRHLWAIGVDTDQFRTAVAEGWSSSHDEWGPHILTSMVKRLDRAVYITIEEFTRGTLAPGLRLLDLRAGGVEYSRSGGFVDDIVPELERMKRDIIDGRIHVAAVPAERSPAPPQP